MRTIDYSLYLVTDRKLAGGRPIEDVVQAGIRGGVTCVQLREKECPTQEIIDLALRLQEILSPRNIPLIINDRLDVALAVGASGVHLGQSDLPLDRAREIAGNSLRIGISAETPEDAVLAELGGADYIGVSPVYSTLTKVDTAPPLGLEGVRKIRQVVGIPLVGIGGVNTENVQGVIQCGADGVAVVSAIVSAPDPEEAARELFRNIHRAREIPGGGP